MRSVEFAPGRRRGKIGGEITLLGAHHPLEIDFELEVPTGDRLRAQGSFSVSYVAWGLPDVSTAILRVAPVVSLEFRVEGRVNDWTLR